MFSSKSFCLCLNMAVFFFFFLASFWLEIFILFCYMSNWLYIYIFFFLNYDGCYLLLFYCNRNVTNVFIQFHSINYFFMKPYFIFPLFHLHFSRNLESKKKKENLIIIKDIIDCRFSVASEWHIVLSLQVIWYKFQGFYISTLTECLLFDPYFSAVMDSAFN